ncbi:hypothetical protein [Amycolatopsis albispora]|uniref:SH3b domain-containing protein n=1 Tax=Amycolatopsis albispora TaxID=1804986 RepID=A0A344L5E8_9PSEU|nr:hypothetical protein [Amycolatopsis albispora]AXB43272.1 hypothetical protein A4R43_12505 [Amycolatopsis albispora]
MSKNPGTGRRLALIGAAVATVAGGVFAVTPAVAAQVGEVGVQHYPCGSSRPPNKDTQGSNGNWPRAIRDLVPQSGSAFSCSDLAKIYHGDKLDYYRWTVGSTDNAIWTYVSAFERGTAGWVLDKNLSPVSQDAAYCP